jgi:hypothetical protein
MPDFAFFLNFLEQFHQMQNWLSIWWAQTYWYWFQDINAIEIRFHGKIFWFIKWYLLINSISQSFDMDWIFENRIEGNSCHKFGWIFWIKESTLRQLIQVVGMLGKDSWKFIWIHSNVSSTLCCHVKNVWDIRTPCWDGLMWWLCVQDEWNLVRMNNIQTENLKCWVFLINSTDENRCLQMGVKNKLHLMTGWLSILKWRR